MQKKKTIKIPGNIYYETNLLTFLIHKSRYRTWVAQTEPKKLKIAAIKMTATVLPVASTTEPAKVDRTNWAINTILLTMATSVPRPRMLVSAFTSTAENWMEEKLFFLNVKLIF